MENFNEQAAVAHVRTPGGIVRMDRAEVDAHNADKANEKFDVLDDSSDEVKALYAPRVLEPVATGSVAEGTVLPPLGEGDPAAAKTATDVGSFTPAMTPEATWADPANPNKFVMQIGSRWFVTDDKGHRFQKGQSAAGYAQQSEAEAQAVKMSGAPTV